MPWGHSDVGVGGAERGLPGDVPATEGEDLKVAGQGVEFNSDQPVRPVAIDADQASQQVNGSVLVGAAQKDDLSLSRAVWDGFGESPAGGAVSLRGARLARGAWTNWAERRAKAGPERCCQRCQTLSCQRSLKFSILA